MKTNQVLIRKMEDFDVYQRSSDEMFNATKLLKQWNERVDNKADILHTQNSGYVKNKDLDDFFNNKSTKEYINVLIQKEGDGNVFRKSKASRGDNAGTWMCAHLFVDFAMWVSPEFKYNVIKFMYDQLIKNRIDAGDSYKILGSQIGKIVNKQFMPVAMQTISKGLNHIVYGRHERNIRNKEADENFLKSLTDLENKIAMLIDEGFLRSYEDVLKYLRLTWQKENQPKIFDN